MSYHPVFDPVRPTLVKPQYLPRGVSIGPDEGVLTKVVGVNLVVAAVAAVKPTAAVKAGVAATLVVRHRRAPLEDSARRGRNGAVATQTRRVLGLVCKRGAGAGAGAGAGMRARWVAAGENAKVAPTQTRAARAPRKKQQACPQPATRAPAHSYACELALLSRTTARGSAKSRYRWRAGQRARPRNKLRTVGVRLLERATPTLAIGRPGRPGTMSMCTRSPGTTSMCPDPRTERGCSCDVRGSLDGGASPREGGSKRQTRLI